MSFVVAKTSAGLVRGQGDRVTRFLGMPYAAAPFGVNRFAAPAPVQPWDGVRDALRFGPTAPGAGLGPDSMMIYPDPVIPGEECLNLNVWTPDVTGCRPVLVWFAGGANVMGSSAQPVFDGTAFARDGVVFVSVNHRLGIEGFAQLPDAPANRAVLDQVAALTWVRDNIANFGGDPGAVTVAGVSSGAGAVLTLLSDLSEDGPLLVMADDVQWLDRGSLGTLAFVARRLDAEPVVLLLAARGTVPPAGFERDFPELPLPPLGDPDAARLLDAQPQPPRGRARDLVLAQSAGNPMALIELARVIAADPAAGPFSSGSRAVPT